MKMKIETMDWAIWLAIILPIIALAGYFSGIEAVLLLSFLLPLFIYIKNEFLVRQLDWKPEYSVGIAVLDEDHKKLLDMVLTLFKAMESAQSKDEAERVLNELLNYTVEHFDREEVLMKKHDYPDLAAHLAEHRAMKTKAAEFRDKFQSNSMEVSRDMLRYLQEWLINHINKTDKAYSNFLVGKGEH
ncbi:MAG: hemerythrin family protein [Magnetococcales bacterium]|nr:hemerythrin family protein [Magnetococcales bacterium]